MGKLASAVTVGAGGASFLLHETAGVPLKEHMGFLYKSDRVSAGAGAGDGDGKFIDEEELLEHDYGYSARHEVGDLVVFRYAFLTSFSVVYFVGLVE